MKALVVLQDFLVDFSDCRAQLNFNTVKRWFEGSKHALFVSKTVKYEFIGFVKYISKENDGVSFFIDWEHVKNIFASDPEFIKKLESTHKKGK